MKYKLWDKISPINDISAIDFLSRSPFIDQADGLINVGEEDEMLITYEEGISKKYVGESAYYGGTINTIVTDDTYIYAGGGTTRTVRKYLKSDLSYVGESPDYGDNAMSVVIG
jgi:hypothetical protein